MPRGCSAGAALSGILLRTPWGRFWRRLIRRGCKGKRNFDVGSSTRTLADLEYELACCLTLFQEFEFDRCRSDPLVVSIERER